MKIKVLNTGSKGNGYVLTDAANESLVIEAGVSAALVSANSERLVGCIYSHEHTDHCGQLAAIQNIVNVYDLPDMWQRYTIGDYNVIPFPVLHDVPNKGYIIANKVEKKVVFFATDLIYNTAVKPYYQELFKRCELLRFDLIMIESNYNEYEFKMSVQGGSDVWGAKNHLSNRECARFLSHICDRNAIQNIMLLHGSNRIGRGVKEKKDPILRLLPKAQITIANKGVSLEI